MKGITLVALVVTIVVLLILAGVSINTVLGDDGIIKKAKEAAETTKRVSAEEEMNRLVLEYQLAKSDENFEDFLQEKINEGRINGATDNGDGTVTISKRVDGKDYTITVKKPVAPTPSVKVGAIRVVSDSTGAGSSLGEASTRKGTTLYIMIESTISGGTTTVSPQVPYAVTENGTYKFTVTGTVNGTTYTKEVSVTVNQFKNSILEDINIKIGDSVNYTYDTASSSYTLESKYSGYSSNQTIAQTTGLTWKVLNVDKENDTVDIISTNPTSSTVYFKNILGYNNGPYLMNEICKAQYSNKTLGVNARSINLLDMEKHLTAAGIAARNAYTNAVKYGTTKTYTSNTKYPSLYANQKGAGPNASSISQPDITKGNDPYEESKKIATTEPVTDTTIEDASDNGLTTTQTLYEIDINETNYGKAASILISDMYWVAARYVSNSTENPFGDGEKIKSATFGIRFAGVVTGGISIGLRKRLALDLFSDLYAAKVREHRLDTLFWECTLRCNLSCRHCGSDCRVDPGVPDMPVEDFLRVLDEEVTPHVDPADVLIIVSGGEVLVREDLERAGAEITRRDYAWGMVTNGMALTPARLESLLRAGLRSVSVSLDGFEREHNWLRRHPQSYDRALQALRLVLREPQLTSDVVTCVTRELVPQLEAFGEMLIAEGVRHWRIFTIFPAGRARDDASLTLSDAQFRAVLDYIRRMRREGRIDVSYACEGFLAQSAPMSY